MRDVEGYGTDRNRRQLALLWPDLVNVQQRVITEALFFTLKVGLEDVTLAFDASLGCGATTLALYRANTKKVVSNDLSEQMIEQAREIVNKYGALVTEFPRTLDPTQYDWRNIGAKGNTFDVVTNLGNSLSMLQTDDDLLQALHEHHRVLRRGGILVVDERNYEHHFLKAPDGSAFEWSGNFVYCGKEKVDITPLEITNEVVRLEYRHRENGLVGQLKLTPFPKNHMHGALQATGFQDIKVFGDYKEKFGPEEPEFLTYVCKK